MTNRNMSQNNVWAVTKGYVPCPNTTQLIQTIDSFTDSYNELLVNSSAFGLHSKNKMYIESGPLRECKTVYILDNQFNTTADVNKFNETFLLLNRLKNVVDPSNKRLLVRSYVTILEPKKQIYSHCDTDGPYWNTIDRYQFYYTGNDNMTQLIDDTLFPIAPGYLYQFDHRQIHAYTNNSNQNLMLMVFDLQKIS